MTKKQEIFVESKPVEDRYVTETKRRKEMRKLYFGLVALMMLTVFAGSAEGFVPRLLSYQGVLTEVGGQPVSNGQYQLTFKIYDVAAEGTAMWTEAQTAEVTNGIFTVILGSSTTLDLPFDTQYYLGITIASEEELSPRVQLCGAPYALGAGMLAGSTNIVPSTGDVGFGTTAPQHKLHIVDTGHEMVDLDIQSLYGSGTMQIQTDNNANNYFGIAKGASGASGSTAGFPLADMSRLVAGNAAGPMMLQVMTNNPLYVVTNNLERMRVTGEGNVGIGTTSPGELLDVNGGVRVGNSIGTNPGTMRWTGSDFEGYNGSSWASLTASGGGSLPSGIAGNTLRHNGSDWLAATNLYNNGTNVGIGTTIPSEALDVTGNIHASGELQGTKAVLGSSSIPGILHVERFGSTKILGNSNGYGGNMYMYDETTEPTINLMADVNGEGGYVGIFGDNGGGVPEIVMDGNYSGSGNPYVRLSGSTSSIAFNTNTTGDDCVILPVNTISAVELAEETGVSASTDGGTTVEFPSSTWTVIKSVTILAPGPGYVIVIGSCQGDCLHNNGSSSIGFYGVSNSPTVVPANQDIQWMLDFAAPSGNYKTPVTVHSVFTAAAGANTYYFLGYEYSGSFSAENVQLSAIYVPTAYGSVSSVATNAPGEDRLSVIQGRTDSDIAKERDEAVAADRDRINRELSEMRGKFSKMEAEIERLSREQMEKD
ncbi:hypothetical protein J7M07_05575 [bacterium]|nr:hypothetical protein [bacterium]